jgi:hypothetical protein
VLAHTLIRNLYHDRCCNGRDIKNHPCVYIFDFVNRAPLADGYHKIQYVTRTYNPGADERPDACVELARILRHPLTSVDPNGDIVPMDGSLQQAINYFKSPAGGKLGDNEAMHKALSKDNSRHVIRVGRSPDILVQDMDVYIAKWTEHSDKQRKADKKSIFKPQGTGIGYISSLDALGSVRSCCEKGCMTDPLPPHEMNVCYDFGVKSNLPKLMYKGGTWNNESDHKIVLNAPMKAITRIREDNRDRKVRWGIYFFNQANDEKLNRVGSVLGTVPAFVKLVICAMFQNSEILHSPPFIEFFTPSQPLFDEPAGCEYEEDDAEMLAKFQALVERQTTKEVAARKPPQLSPRCPTGATQCWFEGTRIYLTNHAEAEQRVAQLMETAKTVLVDVGGGRKDPMRAVGVDVEWSSALAGGAHVHKPALLILCTLDVCVNVHLSKIGDVPQAVRCLLRDGNIVKVGLNFQGDITRLERLPGMGKEDGNGVVQWMDIGHLANRAEELESKAWSLADLHLALCNEWLDKKLCKGEHGAGPEHVRWDEFPLSEDNQQYGANDGYSTIKSFHHFCPPLAAPAPAPSRASTRVLARSESSTTAPQAILPEDVDEMDLANVRLQLKRMNATSTGTAVEVRTRLKSCLTPVTLAAAGAPETVGAGTVDVAMDGAKHQKLHHNHPHVHVRKERNPHLDRMQRVTPATADEMEMFLSCVTHPSTSGHNGRSSKYSLIVAMYNSKFIANRYLQQGKDYRGPINEATVEAIMLRMGIAQAHVTTEINLRATTVGQLPLALTTPIPPAPLPTPMLHAPLPTPMPPALLPTPMPLPLPPPPPLQPPAMSLPPPPPATQLPATLSQHDKRLRKAKLDAERNQQLRLEVLGRPLLLSQVQSSVGIKRNTAQAYLRHFDAKQRGTLQDTNNRLREILESNGIDRWEHPSPLPEVPAHLKCRPGDLW